MSTDIEIDLKFIKQKGPNEFAVNVKLVSSIDKTIVVQRSKSKGINALKKAIKVRDKLLEEALREVIKQEQQGCLWGKVLTDYLTGVMTGSIHTSRNLSAKTLYDYSQSANKYTKKWWRKPAA